tara:strand:- start:52 stop:696 length:645 start_codon:yes stop_codon:yes gene_type:complete
MCNLYSMTSNTQAIRDLFAIAAPALPNIPLLDAIFPGYDAPVVRQASGGTRELVMMHWGFVLPQQDKAPKDVTNARQDRVRASRFWSESFEQRRCLVPATSFAEPKGKRPAIWHWFALVGDTPRPLFAFAGLWRRWRGMYRGEVREMETFAILTTTPNSLVATVHPSRMPVILAPENYSLWLSGRSDDAIALAVPFPAEAMQIASRGDKKDPGL